MNPAIHPKLLNDPVFKRVLADALAIQDRLQPRTYLRKNGQGLFKGRWSRRVA